MTYKGGDVVEVNEQLIKQITQLVYEELNKIDLNQISKKPPKVKSLFVEQSDANKGTDPKEVTIGIGPTFGMSIRRTINDLDHIQVLKEIMAGIEEEGMIPRVIRVRKTSDVSFIGKEAALLSGSGIGIGIQSKGTTIIHQKDLYPLTNLELFPQAPLITLEIYRRIGKNAAKYAKGEQVKPIEGQNDYMVRAKYQVKAALMHTKETEYVVKGLSSININLASN